MKINQLHNSTGRFLRLITVLFVLFQVLGFQFVKQVYAAGGIVYVQPSGLESGPCDSWENACDLQYAIEMAVSGDEIWVALGTYYPTTDESRTASFILKNGVGIYGGFAGVEVLFSERDPVMNITILSGDIGTLGNVDDNSYHVVTGNGTDASARLDGFTITGGNATGHPLDPFGGGVFNDGGSPTLSNLTVSGNLATYGGGIFNRNSSPTLTNISINNNSAERGGGMYNTESSNPALERVTFSDNTALVRGGGMSNSGSNPTLVNVTFYRNSASSGGGMHNVFTSNPALTNVTIKGNSASTQGGAIYNQEGSISIINSIIYGNSGGEIYNDTSVATVTYSIVQGGHSGTGNLNLDPLLGPLASNGGFTQTMAPDAGSPAIDAGTNTGCPATDQRGVTRPQGSQCDIGAYEFVYDTQTFGDVPGDYWALPFIERLFNAGITGGCSNNPLNYCPESGVTRAQMAVFLLRGIHGSTYSPPLVGGSTGFGDVPTNYWAAAWIKQLAAEGITGGCGSGNYCPEAFVTRAQMSVFLLRSKHGSTYSPPSVGGSTGFGDVPVGYWAAAWIKQLVGEAITSGCGGGNYCPEASVTRAQMAVFLVRTFNLP